MYDVHSCLLELPISWFSAKYGKYKYLILTLPNHQTSITNHHNIYQIPSAKERTKHCSLTLIMSKILSHFRPGHDSTSSTMATNPTLSSPTPRISTNDPTLLGQAPTHTNRTREKRPRRDLEAAEDVFQGWVDPYGPAPTVKQWFKWYWHDLLA